MSKEKEITPFWIKILSQEKDILLWRRHLSSKGKNICHWFVRVVERFYLPYLDYLWKGSQKIIFTISRLFREYLNMRNISVESLSEENSTQYCSAKYLPYSRDFCTVMTRVWRHISIGFNWVAIFQLYICTILFQMGGWISEQ